VLFEELGEEFAEFGWLFVFHEGEDFVVARRQSVTKIILRRG
jgi:hypothetical protein